MRRARRKRKRRREADRDHPGWLFSTSPPDDQWSLAFTGYWSMVHCLCRGGWMGISAHLLLVANIWFLHGKRKRRRRTGKGKFQLNPVQLLILNGLDPFAIQLDPFGTQLDQFGTLPDHFGSRPDPFGTLPHQLGTLVWSVLVWSVLVCPGVSQSVWVYPCPRVLIIDLKKLLDFSLKKNSPTLLFCYRTPGWNTLDECAGTLSQYLWNDHHNLLFSSVFAWSI